MVRSSFHRRLIGAQPPWPEFLALRREEGDARGEWLTIETEKRPFTSMLTRLVCSNLSEAFPQRVLHLHSIGQYLGSLLLHRPDLPSAAELRTALGARPTRQLMRFLLPPADSAMQLLNAHPSMRLARPLLCVQLRMHNEWVLRGTPRLIETAAKCAGQLSPELRAPHNSNVSIHIASDNATARDVLIDDLEARIPSVVGYAPAMAEAARKELLADAWLELLLLSRCDALLTTGGSTFGYVARLLTRAPMHHQRYMTRWTDTTREFEAGVDCPLLRTTEPCLMHAWRQDWDVMSLACFRPEAERLKHSHPEIEHLIEPTGERSQCFR